MIKDPWYEKNLKIYIKLTGYLSIIREEWFSLTARVMEEFKEHFECKPIDLIYKLILIITDSHYLIDQLLYLIFIFLIILSLTKNNQFSILCFCYVLLFYNSNEYNILFGLKYLNVSIKLTSFINLLKLFLSSIVKPALFKFVFGE